MKYFTHNGKTFRAKAASARDGSCETFVRIENSMGETIATIQEPMSVDMIIELFCEHFEEFTAA